ncbi:MAG: sugar phosphate nucleotidyltransferase [Bacteroidota bacterium]
MSAGRLVILAGGISSRMKSSAAEGIDDRLQKEAAVISKAMIGVGANARPFLDYLLYNAKIAGYRDVVIVVGEKDNSIRDRYGMLERGNVYGGLTISYAVQPVPAGRTKPSGTADALLHALRSRPDWQGGYFTTCNSDNLYSIDSLRRLCDPALRSAMIDYDRNAFRFERSRAEQYAVIRRSAEGFLADLIEKPSPETVAEIEQSEGRVGVSMNVFRLSYDRILPELERIPAHPLRQEKELPTAVKMMAERFPDEVLLIPVSEHVPDLTSRNDIASVQEYLSTHFPEIF